MCSPKNTDPRKEWALAQPNFKMALNVHITLDRGCREHIPASVNAEVKAQISENARDGNDVSCT